ncbi:MAG: site-specific integrase [Dehalococcoidales bacterium]|nr:site-specific integrase [Dehalococcoidales bacterium]
MRESLRGNSPEGSTRIDPERGAPQSDINYEYKVSLATATARTRAEKRISNLALRWQDVDLLLLQVSVNRSLHQVKGGRTIFRQPKTEKSRRMIALTPSTATLLQEYHDSQNILRESLGYSKLTETDLVFCQYDGKPFLPNTVTHNWIKLVRRAGLSGVRLHDARHTHASLMLKRGIHPKIVQERLGHSSIQITLDTYSHVAPGLQQSAAETFDSIVLPKKPVSELV